MSDFLELFKTRARPSSSGCALRFILLIVWMYLDFILEIYLVELKDSRITRNDPEEARSGTHQCDILEEF